MSHIPPEMVSRLIASTQEVFETMVFRSLGCQSPIEGEALRPRSNVVGTVAFAGERCGIVVFYSTTETAQEIAGAMLGIPPAQINGEMPDAIGEITNMIAGAFRTKMAADGRQPWAISVPTVTIGSDFYTKYVSDVRRVLCPFTMDGSEIFVELILTQN